MTNHHYLGIELPVLARPASESKFDWIYRILRSRICEGSLRPGVRIPSTRDLARQWGVSRGIVDAAYDALRQEGYLESHVGSGTWVCHTLPDHFVAASTVPAPRSPTPKDVPSGIPQNFETPFLARLADPKLFPLRAWRAAVQRSLKTLSPAVLSSEDPAGHAGLREQIAMHLGATRGIHCTGDDILVTTGIRHGVKLAAVVTAPGRDIFIEDPGFPTAYAAFHGRGNRIRPTAVDQNGICLRTICAHPEPAVVYVTPAHQSPLGVALAPNRRATLLAWAAASNSYIIEDDYDSEINYSHAPPPALKAQDAHDRVIFCGSFNKTLLPSLRLGFMVVPRALRAPIAQCWAEMGRTTGIFDQIILHELLASGDFARHLRRVRGVYLKRRNILISALHRSLGEEFSISGEQAGFHFVLWPPKRLNARAIPAHLHAHALRVQSIRDFSHQHHDLDDGLLLGFAAIETERLRAASHQLGALLTA